MKRFYKEVSVYKSVDGFGVQLDDKPVKTPAKNLLIVEKENIATELAFEWQAQEKEILPATMPANQIVITAIDGTSSREEVEKHILNYINTDLLFFRSDASPYREKQEEEWGKWTGWFEKNFSVRLKTTEDIEALTQDPAIKDFLKAYIEKLDFLSLVLFDCLIEDTSSYVLTLSLFEKASSAEDIFKSIFLEDLVRATIYDEDKYGAAPDQIKKREMVMRNLKAAEKLISMMR